MDGSQLLLVVIAAIVVTAVAHRRGLQTPLILVVLGMAASFIPGMPRLEIEPEVILSFVLPPLLYSTAVEFSVIHFMRNLRPILGLGVLLVVATTLLVGGAANIMVPELSLGAALVLGAVVAPPDAVSAVAIGRRLGLSKRVMTILTGESLVNDAAALTVFTIATVAVTRETAFIDGPVLFFGYGVVVGLFVGLLLAVIVMQTRSRLNNAGLETVLGIVVPFAAYFVAEELHASGVVAVVAAGFAIGHNSDRTGVATRMQERDVWRTVSVLLEAFVFAYMGLQLKFVLEGRGRRGPADRGRVARRGRRAGGGDRRPDRLGVARPWSVGRAGAVLSVAAAKPAQRAGLDQTKPGRPPTGRGTDPAAQVRPGDLLDRHARGGHAGGRRRYSGRHRWPASRFRAGPRFR